MTTSLFDANATYAENRQNIADREYGLMLKNSAIIAASAVAGALGGTALDTKLMPTAAIAGGVGGTFISDVLTKKDRAILEMDKKMLASYTDGNQHWG